MREGHTRRRLLGTALAGVGVGLGTANAAKRDVAGPGPSAASLVKVGQTGVDVSFLAQGTGFNGGGRASDHTRLGVAGFEKLLRHALDRGVRFLDMADMYGTHEYVKRSLKGIPRERYTLLTKIWPREAYWTKPSTDGRAEVDRIRKELASDTIDVCLLHCMMNADWANEYARQRDGLAELKSKGRRAGAWCFVPRPRRAEGGGVRSLG